MVRLENLLVKRLYLHSKKYSLISSIYYEKSNYLKIYKNMHKLNSIILKEIMLNKKIAKKILRLHKRTKTNKLKDTIVSLVILTNELTTILNEELILLKEIGLFNVLVYEIEILFFKENKLSFFSKGNKKFMNALEEEHKVSRKFLDIVKKSNLKLNKEFLDKKKKFYAARKIIHQIHEANKKLTKGIGNIPVVKKQGEEILKQLDKLKKYDIYHFIEDDVKKFRSKVVYVIKHPKDNKFKYIITSAYIVSPGTFELTFAILFIRYMSKYAKKKISR